MPAPIPPFFHPLIQTWFADRFDRPTEAQRLAWPKIAAGEHVLLTAPTGTGKTLTAFLWALNQLIAGHWTPGRIRVLYVSPLRALNNDIRRNLETPLGELAAVFADAGQPMAPVRLFVRSGDTPPSERRAMNRQPPEILITTPESLNILLTTQRAQTLFSGINTVILDEVHAVSGGKRGTHLITAVERLVPLAGEFQRVGLSATVRPLDRVAKWVGGYRLTGGGTYEPRPVTVVESNQEKQYALRVCAPGPDPRTADSADSGYEQPVWIGAAREIRRKIDAHRSTLVFANSRRGVERLARLVNGDEPEKVVYAHHGSLSREIREVVEERLKAGALRGIVATNSLELGIDVGAVDQVILFETPPSVSSLIQRIGRAGHGVGEISRGSLVALYPDDLIDAAVLVEAFLEQAVEPQRPPVAPLDVLAQVILSMTVYEMWQVDALFDAVRAAQPFHTLSRARFDLVVEMLTGRYRGKRVAAIKPRVAFNRIDGTLQALPGVARLLYSSGGTIADRGYFAVRLNETGAVIGELDEEYVWERKRGDIMSLGVQAWRIERVRTNDVLVTHAGGTGADTPFWRCEERFRDVAVALRRGEFLEWANQHLDDGGLEAGLKERHCFEDDAAQALRHFLKTAKQDLGTALPHRHHVVVEPIASSASGVWITVLHNEWGGKVNRTLAMALEGAFERRGDASKRVAYTDRAVAVMSETPLTADGVLALVPTAETAELVRDKLGSAGLFGACFRENAGRALLVLRRGFGRRTPLWVTRERAKNLFSSIARLSDFPITLETYRACLQDELAIDALDDLLAEVRNGQIAVTEVAPSSPSALAQGVVWRLTGTLMYEDDTPLASAGVPSRALLDEVVASAALRPRIPASHVRELEAKLHRTHPGYAPKYALELVEWIKERVCLSLDEWRALGEAIERDHGLDMASFADAVGDRLIRVDGFVVGLESLPRMSGVLTNNGNAALPSPFADVADVPARRVREALASAADDSVAEPDRIADIVEEWLRFYGPVPLSDMAARFPLDAARMRTAVRRLQDNDLVVVDELTEGTTCLEMCHVENLRRLIAGMRRRRRPSLKPLPAAALPLALAEHQGVDADGAHVELASALEPLFGYAADAPLWEQEILPARLSAYRGAALDDLLATSNLEWFGAGPRKVVFSLAEERELFAGLGDASSATRESTPLFPDEPPGRFTVMDLVSRSGDPPDQVTPKLLDAAWRGEVTASSFRPVRGVGAGDLPPRTTRGRRSRWQRTHIDTSVWYRLLPVETDEDALLDGERLRDQARVLVDRYGVVFRTLLERELPGLRWRAVFRTLRLLELTGEVSAGYFFDGIPGIQFVSEEMLARLRSGLGENRLYWLNAADPAAPSGLGIAGLDMPPRVTTTHLAFSGHTLVLVSKRTGKHLTFGVAPDDDRAGESLAVIAHLLTRDVSPLTAITVELINERPAARSPYRPLFEKRFDVVGDHRTLRLSKRY